MTVHLPSFSSFLFAASTRALLLAMALAIPVAGARAQPAGTVNVSLPANGGTVTASSFHSTPYAPAAVINGDRKGTNWGGGGGWNDGTSGVYPDWVQVTFSGTKSIREINVFTVQDNYVSPAEPTTGMTFTKYGIRSFQMQYWTGSAWSDVPGGSVTGNSRVWRQFTLATPISTDRIRVLVNAALDNWSRITEIEAWGTAAASAPAADTAAPSVPAGLSGTALSPTQVRLNWSASTDNVGVTGYYVYLNDAPLTTTTGTTFTHSGLTAGTTYRYRVSAFDAVPNHSAWTAAPVAVTTTAAPAPDTAAPSVPGGLTGTALSQTQIRLNWSAATDNVAVTGYYVYLNDAPLTTTTSTTFTHSGLTAGTTYRYRVSAFDAVPNHSAWTATPVVVTTTAAPAPDTAAPSVPAGLTATALSSTQVRLNWSTSTDNVGVTGYYVYLNDAPLGTTTSPTYTHSGLVAGTTYNYRVSAFDAVPNHSAWTASPVAVTTPGGSTGGGSGGGGTPSSSKFIPTFLVYYGGGPVLTSADASKLAKFDLIDLDRFRYNNIGGNTWSAIKAINPNVQIYVYQDGTEVNNSSDSTLPQFLNNVGRYNTSRGHPMGTLNGNNPALFLLDSSGSRVYNQWFSNPGAGSYYYLLDFGSAAYQSYWVQSVKADIADQPWRADGIFTDLCMTFPAAAGHNAIPAKYPSNAAWSTAMNSFTSGISAGVRAFSQKLWCNKGDTRFSDGVAAWMALDASPTPPDVLMEEGAFAVAWGAAVQFFPEADWKRQVDILGAIRNSKITMLSHTQLAPGGTGTDNYGKPVTYAQALWYSLGSFLLGKNDTLNNAYFMFNGAGEYTKIWWHDEYDQIDLGRAMGAYAVTSVGGTNVYWREFERGYVYVNPTANNVSSVALPRSVRRLTQATLTSAASLPSVSSISLMSHEAAILLK